MVGLSLTGVCGKVAITCAPLVPWGVDCNLNVQLPLHITVEVLGLDVLCQALQHHGTLLAATLDAFQHTHAITLQSLQESLMASVEQLEGALQNMSSMIDAGFQSLVEHVQAETLAVVAAINAAKSGDPAALDHALALTQGMAASFQTRTTDLAAAIDAEIPTP